MLCRLIHFALAVLKLLKFKVCVIIGISTIDFSIFPALKGLKTSNKGKNIILFINLFVSLIELKMELLINYWTNASKFKIDKITYS